VSRSLGLFGGFSRYGMGAEYDLNAPSWPSDECLFAMGSDVGLAGYGWVFPYGGRRARVGVGVIKPTSPERPLDLLNRFITEHRLLRGRLDVNSAIECHQGVVPSEPYAGPLGTGRMLVVGDAAGQVSAIAGEGIRFALEAGGLAGRLIGEASVAGASVADVVRTYQETWNRLHGKGLRLAHSINRRACEFDDASWDRWVRAASGLTPRTMASLLRGDFSVGLMLRVFSESPATAGSATLKTMLSRLRAGREQ
jgi:digeranylgeranylglycerophospholipid reductase